jgi:DNA-binding protein H-NS
MKNYENLMKKKRITNNVNHTQKLDSLFDEMRAKKLKKYRKYDYNKLTQK